MYAKHSSDKNRVHILVCFLNQWRIVSEELKARCDITRCPLMCRYDVLRPTADKTLCFVKYNIVIWPRGNVTVGSFLNIHSILWAVIIVGFEWVWRLPVSVSSFGGTLPVVSQKKIVQHMTAINIFHCLCTAYVGLLQTVLFSRASCSHTHPNS